MPTYGYVIKSGLLCLLIFSTMSILNDSGWARWQDAENPVSNWQAHSIKVLNIANIGSTQLKNYSPVKSNSSGSLSRCPQHRFQSTKAQGQNGPLTTGHFAFRVQTKIKLQVEKLLESQRIEFWPLVKNLCKLIQNTSWLRCQLCNDIRREAKGGDCGKGVPGFNERFLLSYGNVSLPYIKSSFKAQNYTLNSTEGCRRLGRDTQGLCLNVCNHWIAFGSKVQKCPPEPGKNPLKNPCIL